MTYFQDNSGFCEQLDAPGGFAFGGLGTSRPPPTSPMEDVVDADKFTYGDYNPLILEELAEIYSYGERQNFLRYRESFLELCRMNGVKVGLEEKCCFWGLADEQRAVVLREISRSIDQIISKDAGLSGVDPFHVLQYIILSDSQQCTKFETLKETTEIELEIASNTVDLLKFGIYTQLHEFLLTQTSTIRDIENLRTFEHSQRIRITLAVMNTMLEISRRICDAVPDAKQASPVTEFYVKNRSCIDEFLIEDVLDWDDGFRRLFYRLSLLLDKFCSEIRLSFPVMKTVSLIWKLIYVATDCTGIVDQRYSTLKHHKRASMDLDPFPEDRSTTIIARMQPVDVKASFGGLFKDTRPQLRGSTVNTGGGGASRSQLRDLFSSSIQQQQPPHDGLSDNNGPSETAEALMPGTPMPGGGPGSPGESTTIPGHPTTEDVEEVAKTLEEKLIEFKQSGSLHKDQLSIAAPVPPEGTELQWRPKVTVESAYQFVVRMHEKYVDTNFFPHIIPASHMLSYIGNVAALPPPIQDSCRMLQRHMYQSCAEVEECMEGMMDKFPFLARQSIIAQRVSNRERLYRIMLPILPNFCTNMLKLWLSTCPNCASPNPNLNISLKKFPSSCIAEYWNKLDSNRQSEIISKCISAILLNLYKQFKLTNIFQAEALAQQCVLGNGIRLILKLLNCNMLKQISNQHDVPALNPPVIVNVEMGNMVEVSRQIVANGPTTPEIDEAEPWTTRGLGDDGTAPETSPYQISWRNMFASINMTRFLVKLVTNHQHRIVLLHAMKSTLILRRVLKVRQTMLQYYVLKLIKCQVRLLGKQWRKTNMKLFYAIYRMLRHRINDDWAYAQIENSYSFPLHEREISDGISSFHSRRYRVTPSATPSWATNDQTVADPPDVQMVNFDHDSPLGPRLESNIVSLLQNYKVSAFPVNSGSCSPGENYADTFARLSFSKFQKNWDSWVQSEVIDADTDWDKLITA